MKTINIIILGIVSVVLTGCGSSDGGSERVKSSTTPRLMNISGNINGSIVLDSTNERFGVTQNGSHIYSFEKEEVYKDTHVDFKEGLKVEGVYVGFIGLAPHSSGGNMAVLAHKRSGKYYYLDIYTDGNGVEIFQQSSRQVDLTVDDLDGDNIRDGVDNCTSTFNPHQLDDDEDGIGNLCDATPIVDIDSDGVPSDIDNCVFNYNPEQDTEACSGDPSWVGVGVIDYCQDGNTINWRLFDLRGYSGTSDTAVLKVPLSPRDGTYLKTSPIPPSQGGYNPGNFLCDPGSYICYGASQESTGKHWGVGLNGRGLPKSTSPDSCFLCGFGPGWLNLSCDAHYTD